MIVPLLVVSYLSLFLFGVTDNIRGPIFPEIIKYFNVSDSKASLAFAISSFSGFVISFISIYLLKKYSRKKILVISCLLFIVTLIGLGTVQHFNFFILFSALFGVALTMIGMIPNILVPIASPIEKRQQLISGLHAMYGIASLISPQFVTFVYKMNGNWRSCFLYSAFIVVLFLIYVIKIPIEQLDLGQNKKNENRIKFFSRNYPFQFFLAFTLSFAVIFEVMLSSRLALFVSRIRHFDIVHSNLYVSYFFFAMLLGRLTFSFKKFDFQIPHQLFVLGLIAGVCCLGGIYLTPLFLVLSGFFISPYYPLIMTYVSQKFPDDLDQAVSLIIAIDSVMLSLMHLLIGKMTDQFNIVTAMAIGTSFIFISIVMINLFNFYFGQRKFN